MPASAFAWRLSHKSRQPQAGPFRRDRFASTAFQKPLQRSDARLLSAAIDSCDSLA